MTVAAAAERRPHKGFEETHRDIIETTVRLVSEKGVEAVSIAAVARAAGINRTTVYYHFDSREALIAAVKAWSSEQIATAFSDAKPQAERIDFITRFVLENPEIIKLWIDEFIAPGDVRDRYPHWQALVDGIAAKMARSEEGGDAEVYAVILLSSAIIGPRIFKNSVAPGASIDKIVERFRKEQQRLLKHDALLKA